MPSVNKVILIGNLTKDPSVKFLPNGDAVCNFSIACNETWKDKNGQKQEKVEFINIVMYRKLAEIAGEYLKKGRPVYLEGRLQTREWEKEGIKRYTTEIIADSMQMLGGKDGNQESNAPSAGQQRQAAPAQKPADPGGFNDLDDDIPFMNPYKFNWRSI